MKGVSFDKKVLLVDAARIAKNLGCRLICDPKTSNVKLVRREPCPSRS